MNSVSPESKKLKRMVIKEELVELLGDFKKAVILNQFIYWSERVKDTDIFLQEEIKRKEKHGLVADFKLQYGWIYKTAEELSEETMLGLSKASMGRHITEIIKMGYLERRNNPTYKWDKTNQYRVNLLLIIKDLNERGYALENYPLYDAFSKMKPQDFKTKRQSNQNETAIPEITSKITSNKLNKNIYTARAHEPHENYTPEEIEKRRKLARTNWLEG